MRGWVGSGHTIPFTILYPQRKKNKSVLKPAHRKNRRTGAQSHSTWDDIAKNHLFESMQRDWCSYFKDKLPHMVSFQVHFIVYPSEYVSYPIVHCCLIAQPITIRTILETRHRRARLLNYYLQAAFDGIEESQFNTLGMYHMNSHSLIHVNVE